MPMSMRIESTAGVAASANQTTTSQASATPVTSTKDSPASTTPVDPSTGEPKPLKFPWISNLTLRLQENAQKDKISPFPPAEIAGETLNKLA